MKFKDIRVGCFEGHKGRERPAWVELEGVRIEIDRILDRWYEGPAEAGGQVLSYFKVRLADGQEIIIRHVELFDRWGMVESG